MEIRRLVPILLLALACARAEAQAYKPTPANRCDNLAALRIGPERGSPLAPMPHELMAQLAEARAACEQAVKDEPKAARLHAQLARVRALGGDSAGALEAARKGAELGSANAQAMLGVILADGAKPDYAAALDLFRRAAKQGSPHAHFNLAVLYANGRGVEQDDADAANEFRQAAQGGDVLAMQIYAQRHDAAQAEAWLRKAAESLYAESGADPLRVAALGRARPDSAALLAWYRAKAQAEPWAQAYLGALYEAGQWVRQDAAAAASWYRRAGEARYVPAQWRMAKLYNEGRGVPQDRAEARRWGEMWQVQRCDEVELAEAGANACDRFAADRYDPQRAVPGVDSFCMRRFAERAIKACGAAVKQSPSTVRYRTQLARALAHTGRFEEARREAGAAAAAASSASMILMGVMSQRGLGGPVDGAAALAWYRKAADAGDPRGVALVSASAWEGVGVAKGSPEAKKLMDSMYGRSVTRAPTQAQQAEAGDARAQFNTAAQLERVKRYDEALAWYQRSAAQGFRPAEMNLAQMYENGIGVKQDLAEARGRYRRLAGLGDAEARYRAAKLAAAAGDYAEALKLYERAARDDDWRAILDLGELYENGRGVPRDVPRAVRLYERVAEQSAWARFKLGVLHLQGDGIPRDYAKAQRWLKRSADEGNPGARNNLAWMHEKGLGMPVDYLAARELYLAALDGGNFEAKGNLERFFAAGLGAPSGAGAESWYRGGAEAGVASAQYRLGHMYARGEGVPRDERAGLEWLLKAADQGHPEASREAADLLQAMGQREAAQMLRSRAAVPPPAWPQGIATRPPEDFTRTVAIRVAGVAVAQRVAIDAGLASVYDIIRWFPETDGRK
jgi:TPR repeat protein